MQSLFYILLSDLIGWLFLRNCVAVVSSLPLEAKYLHFPQGFLVLGKL